MEYKGGTRISFPTVWGGLKGARPQQEDGTHAPNGKDEHRACCVGGGCLMGVIAWGIQLQTSRRLSRRPKRPVRTS